MGMTPLGSKQTTIDTTLTPLSSLLATGLYASSAFLERMDFVVLQAQAHDCRWTDDGVLTPTTTVGNLLLSGASLTIRSGQFATFQIIGTASGSIVETMGYKTG